MKYKLVHTYKTAIKSIIGCDIEPKQSDIMTLNSVVFEIPDNLLKDTNPKNKVKMTNKIYDFVLSTPNIKYSCIVAIMWVKVDLF